MIGLIKHPLRVFAHAQKRIIKTTSRFVLSWSLGLAKKARTCTRLSQTSFRTKHKHAWIFGAWRTLVDRRWLVVFANPAFEVEDSLDDHARLRDTHVGGHGDVKHLDHRRNHSHDWFFIGWIEWFAWVIRWGGELRSQFKVVYLRTELPDVNL